MEVETLSYEEAKSWFWIRTWLWFLVCAIVSVMTFFAYGGQWLKTFPARFWVSLICGIGAVLMGLGAAAISLQFVWQRSGWRFGFALNGPACAAMSALMAFLCCGFILSFMQNDPNHLPPPAMIQTTYSLMQFGTASAGLWGFVFGSWFALRRDKYFVEPI
ncbi:MAG: hypothetical protein ACP5R5_08975 [Armatimonadota bacterium]